MLVERIFIDNPLRNFHYLVACPETGEAVAIDPVDVDRVLEVAKGHGWRVTASVITHHHLDHAGGREALKQATGARIYAHTDAPLDGIDARLGAGDVVRVGRGVALTALDTPGHTMSHVCLVGGGRLFSGDTLFIAGCGNCHFGGHPETLWDTFSTQIYALPQDLVVEPGHDYAVNNLRFSLDREPGNAGAQAALAVAEAASASGGFFQSTLGEERAHNPFFRIQSPELRERLDLPADAPDRDVFLALRALRNRW